MVFESLNEIREACDGRLELNIAERVLLLHRVHARLLNWELWCHDHLSILLVVHGLHKGFLLIFNLL